MIFIKIEIKAIDLATKYYDGKTLNHALRVANLAAKDILNRNYKEDEARMIFVVGLLHDILEDTPCSMHEIVHVFQGAECMWGESLPKTVGLLTHDKEISYQEYMEKILSSSNELAIIVKRADLKDHFSQNETLTQELANKYLPYVKDFL